MYSIQKLIVMGQEQVIILRKNTDGTITCFNQSLDNTDYQAYLKWVAQGNTPQPAGS
jgi:hypothetical protein